jgi:sugar lactone lactonase YvrE
MKGNPLRHVRYLLALVCMASMAGPVSAHDDTAAASSATFTTLTVLPLAIEGLAGDNHSSLYTTGRAATPNRCPVWQINMAGTPPVQPVQVGSIPNATGDACNPSGIAFDRSGNIYVADAAQGGVIWRVTGADPNPATPFATGVPGTNGIAFDRQGNLWTGDGTSGQGRVWKISPTGGNCAGGIQVGCIEAFRVPPLANLKGIGRQISTLQPPGAANPQSLVANGVAFDWWGDLYVADTARGAIWRVRFDRNGNVRSPMGCDSTFMRDTLCLSNVFVAHPIIEGVDGIALDRAGNIWAAANERNAIGVVTPDRRVYEFFRNPGNGQGLRNSADTADGNKHILELPTSPYLNGNRLCVAQSDGDRRDNSPRASGEVNGGSGSARGKISCLDQTLYTSGLPLPLQ